MSIEEMEEAGRARMYNAQLEDIINEYDAMLLAMGLMDQLSKDAKTEYLRIREKPGHSDAIESASRRRRKEAGIAE